MGTRDYQHDKAKQKVKESFSHTQCEKVSPTGSESFTHRQCEKVSPTRSVKNFTHPQREKVLPTSSVGKFHQYTCFSLLIRLQLLGKDIEASRPSQSSSGILGVSLQSLREDGECLSWFLENKTGTDPIKQWKECMEILSKSREIFKRRSEPVKSPIPFFKKTQANVFMFFFFNKLG